jgi:Pyruvate/2-oxoacid:ferredoxin oxidoreductase delta subunit
MIKLSDVKPEQVKQNYPEAARLQEQEILPKINLTKCEKIHDCAVFCPKNAIIINSRGFPEIDYKLCDSCLICLRECPAMAISEARK